jgi:hypothetical protein
MGLFAVIDTILSTAWDAARAYTFGVWFMLRHPLQFMSFVAEWRKFQTAIAHNDDAASAGYYDLNRAQRRRLQRGIK